MCHEVEAPHNFTKKGLLKTLAIVKYHVKHTRKVIKTPKELMEKADNDAKQFAKQLMKASTIKSRPTNVSLLHQHHAPISRQAEALSLYSLALNRLAKRIVSDTAYTKFNEAPMFRMGGHDKQKTRNIYSPANSFFPHCLNIVFSRWVRKCQSISVGSQSEFFEINMEKLLSSRPCQLSRKEQV